ncbi:MAG: hypothetical protein MI755_03780 [Sphingomonadales bacterium]|nr:hypothetical protein [Sphingomonadales bacterium]
MGYLDKLVITHRVIVAAKPRRRVETAEYRRNKLIAHLEEQIELVSLQLTGRPLELVRKRGHRVQKVRPRIWWKTVEDGKVCAEIRYNKVALNLLEKGTTIEVPNLKHLPASFRTVIRGVKAGELDGPPQNAARKSRQ